LKDRLLTIWAYAVEIVATILVYIALVTWVGTIAIASYVNRTLGDWKTGLGIAFGAAIALWAAFFALLATDFGHELKKRGSATMYSAAIVFSMLVFLGTFLFLIALPRDFSSATAQLVALVLIYATINCFTMVLNLHGLLRLWQDWVRFRSS
jgi:hypothetical protein